MNFHNKVSYKFKFWILSVVHCKQKEDKKESVQNTKLSNHQVIFVHLSKFNEEPMMRLEESVLPVVSGQIYSMKIKFYGLQQTQG